VKNSTICLLVFFIWVIVMLNAIQTHELAWKVALNWLVGVIPPAVVIWFCQKIPRA